MSDWKSLMDQRLAWGTPDGVWHIDFLAELQSVERADGSWEASLPWLDGPTSIGPDADAAERSYRALFFSSFARDAVETLTEYARNNGELVATIEEVRGQVSEAGKLAHAGIRDVVPEVAMAMIHSGSRTIVEFWAPWCGPCTRISPQLRSLGEQFDGVVEIVSINVDEHRDFSMAHNVRSVPVIAAFEGGVEVGRVVGARPPAIDALVASLAAAAS